MPGGMSKRLYKKRYKAALTRIADKIPAAFASKADRKRWISQVTNLRMKDLKKEAKNGMVLVGSDRADCCVDHQNNVRLCKHDQG